MDDSTHWKFICSYGQMTNVETFVYLSVCVCVIWRNKNGEFIQEVPGSLEIPFDKMVSVCLRVCVCVGLKVCGRVGDR